MKQEHPTPTAAAASLVDASQCPLCGQANRCAVAAGADPQSCWCMQTRIAPQALAAIPAAERGQRCICPQCGRGAEDGKS